jgi:hypothetical protein
MTESMQAATHSESRATVDHSGRVAEDASRQCAEAVVLVRPARFAFNSETAASNSFQQPPPHLEGTAARARAEHGLLCDAIRAAGVRVCVVDDTPRPVKPDAIFPNNWVSWHRDGTVILYPMRAPNRRVERRPELLATVAAEVGFRSRRLLDFSVHEREGRFLEGTGSLVLDHAHRFAYACRSARTDESLVRAWARAMEYEPVVFDAYTSHGSAPYHTNVLLAIGARWAVVCAESIADADRDRVLGCLRATGRDVIAIGHRALDSFAANILELSARGPGGERRSVLALSRRAADALRAEPDAWLRLVSQVDQVLESEVSTIEHVGGGSVRCMLAEAPIVDARGGAR